MGKTTFNVRKKRWDLFNRECKAASMRRDDHLDRVLMDEVELLAKIPPCDATGQKWLRSNWVSNWSKDDTELTPVAISLSPETLTAIKSACDRAGVPRDAFFDCALEFLNQRLLEAVVVIKKPRTTVDLVARMLDVIEQGKAKDVSDSDGNRWIVEVAREWEAKRELDALLDGFYEKRLSWTAQRVQEVNAWGELSDHLLDQLEQL